MQKQCANDCQHSFSSENVPTLHLAIPALEKLHASWETRSQNDEYTRFHAALNAGMALVEKYNNKTAKTDAYIITMCESNWTFRCLDANIFDFV